MHIFSAWTILSDFSLRFVGKHGGSGSNQMCVRMQHVFRRFNCGTNHTMQTNQITSFILSIYTHAEWERRLQQIQYNTTRSATTLWNQCMKSVRVCATQTVCMKNQMAKFSSHIFDWTMFRMRCRIFHVHCTHLCVLASSTTMIILCYWIQRDKKISHTHATCKPHIHTQIQTYLSI